MAFKKFDADGSGELAEGELKKLMTSELCAPVRTRTFKSFVRDMDKDGNGTVDLEEFLLWYTKETDINGIHSKWARSLETRAARAALQSVKLARKGVVKAVEGGKDAARRAKDLYIEKFQTSPELREMMTTHRYSRKDAEKALRLNGGDLQRSLAYLKERRVSQQALEIDFSDEEDDY